MVDLVTITSKSGKKVKVAREAAGQFQGFINDLEAAGYQINSLGGYANRANVNKPSVKSKHALGYAIDINPDKNPNIRGVSREQRAKNPSKYTNMPIDTVQQLAKKWNIGWGYNWKTISDAMHFSVAPNEGGKPLNLPFDGKSAPKPPAGSENIKVEQTPKYEISTPQTQTQTTEQVQAKPQSNNLFGTDNLFGGSGINVLNGAVGLAVPETEKQNQMFGDIAGMNLGGSLEQIYAEAARAVSAVSDSISSQPMIQSINPLRSELSNIFDKLEV